MGAFRKSFPAAKVTFGGGRMTGLLPDEKTAVNAFNVAKKITTGWMPKKGENLEIIDGVNQLPAEFQDEYKKSVKEVGGQAKYTLQGKSADLLSAWKNLRPTATISDFGKALRIRSNNTSLAYDMVWLVDKLTERPVEDPVAMLQKLKREKFGSTFNTFITTLWCDSRKN